MARFLDNPEPAPGVRLGTPKSSPNKDAIIGGAAGGAVTIVLVITICFFLRWRRRKVSTPVPQPVVDASESQPSMNKIRPVSTMNKILQLVTNLKKMDDGIDGHTMSSITGPIQKPSVPSLSEQPLAPMWNVRVSCPVSRRISTFAHRMWFLAHSFYILRTQIIHLRSLGTKDFRRHRPCLFKDPYRRSMEPEM